MTPDAGKDVIKLDVDGAEGQKSGHCHLRNGASIPWKLWNLSRVLGCSDRSLELCLAIFSSNSSKNKKRGGYQRPDEDNN